MKPFLLGAVVASLVFVFVGRREVEVLRMAFDEAADAIRSTYRAGLLT